MCDYVCCGYPDAVSHVDRQSNMHGNIVNVLCITEDTNKAEDKTGLEPKSQTICVGLSFPFPLPLDFAMSQDV